MCKKGPLGTLLTPAEAERLVPLVELNNRAQTNLGMLPEDSPGVLERLFLGAPDVDAQRNTFEAISRRCMREILEITTPSPDSDSRSV